MAQVPPAQPPSARRFFLVIIAAMIFAGAAIVAFFVDESAISVRSVLGIIAVGFIFSELARL